MVWQPRYGGYGREISVDGTSHLVLLSKYRCEAEHSSEYLQFDFESAFILHSSCAGARASFVVPWGIFKTKQNQNSSSGTGARANAARSPIVSTPSLACVLVH